MIKSRLFFLLCFYYIGVINVYAMEESMETSTSGFAEEFHNLDDLSENLTKMLQKPHSYIQLNIYPGHEANGIYKLTRPYYHRIKANDDEEIKSKDKDILKANEEEPSEYIIQNNHINQEWKLKKVSHLGFVEKVIRHPITDPIVIQNFEELWEIKRKNTYLNEIEMNLEELKDLNEDYGRKNKNLKAEAFNLKNQYTQNLQHQSKKMNAQTENLKKLNQEITSKYDVLKENHSKLTVTLNKFKTKEKEYGKDIKKLNIEKEEFSAQNVNLTKELAKLKMQLEKKKELNCQNFALTEEVNSLRKELEEKEVLKKQNFDLGGEIKKLKTELEKHENLNISLEKKKDYSELKINILESANARYKSEIKMLKSKKSTFENTSAKEDIKNEEVNEKVECFIYDSSTEKDEKTSFGNANEVDNDEKYVTELDGNKEEKEKFLKESRAELGNYVIELNETIDKNALEYRCKDLDAQELLDKISSGCSSLYLSNEIEMNNHEIENNLMENKKTLENAKNEFENLLNIPNKKLLNVAKQKEIIISWFTIQHAEVVLMMNIDKSKVNVEERMKIEKFHRLLMNVCSTNKTELLDIPYEGDMYYDLVFAYQGAMEYVEELEERLKNDVNLDIFRGKIKPKKNWWIQEGRKMIETDLCNLHFILTTYRSKTLAKMKEIIKKEPERINILNKQMTKCDLFINDVGCARKSPQMVYENLLRIVGYWYYCSEALRRVREKFGQ